MVGSLKVDWNDVVPAAAQDEDHCIKGGDDDGLDPCRNGRPVQRSAVMLSISSGDDQVRLDPVMGGRDCCREARRLSFGGSCVVFHIGQAFHPASIKEVADKPFDDTD